jgi:ATP-dependent DNA helicase RecG
MNNLDKISIQFFKGVGPAKAKIFENLGVATVEDLLYLFPRRYEDRREMTPVARLEPEKAATVCGIIQGINQRRSYYNRKQVTELIIDDRSGRLTCVWFNQPYLDKYFRAGQKIVCYGKAGIYKGRLQMVSPEYEVIAADDAEEEQLNTQRIVPIYPLTRGVTQRYLRKLMMRCLEDYSGQLKDELPVTLRNTHHLVNLKRGLRQIHFPDSMELQDEAMRRVSFEEFYFFQLSVLLRRLNFIGKPGFAHKITDADTLRFLQDIPYELTRAQKRVIQEIRADMSSAGPMLRLLQGDVGSGKTVVALYGGVMAARQGCQAAVMAPTEILARQHYENISRHLGKVPGNASEKIGIVLLTSGLTRSRREAALRDIREGNCGLVIGTHALLGQDVVFKKLSYVVIDEQHKFGVGQRALLAGKGQNPDTLIMTATPIPRTLCLTLYGDLALSIIDEMPPGRGKVVTELYKTQEADQVYARVRRALDDGRQAYIVFPLVEESEALDLKAAETMFREFQKTIFKGVKAGIAHGRLKRQEVERTMADFKNGEIQLLVATTVLEVGVDVPNASVMVIEHAQRFGLAQLHQLRGRIGRGGRDGLCLLIADDSDNGDDARERLEAVVSTSDGFILAQRDLEIRGPGRFFGRHQHGLNELKIVNPARQMDVLELARSEAKSLVQLDPGLREAEHQNLREVIERRYPAYLDNLAAG